MDELAHLYPTAFSNLLIEELKGLTLIAEGRAVEGLKVLETV